MRLLAKYGVGISHTLAVIYVFYAWYTYSGLFRLFAEWQLETFGAYDLKVTGVVLVLALGIPVALVLQFFARPEPEQPAPPARWSGFASSPALAAGLCLLAFAIAGAAGWIGHSKTQQQLQLEAVDLSTGHKPASGHVVMTALAQADLASQYTYTTKGSGSARTYAYVPLTSSTWRRGEPIVYFLRTFPDFTRGKTGAFRTTTQPALLVPNGLPGPILEFYRKQGVALADPPIVLDPNLSADADPYFLVSLLAGMLAFIFLIVAIGLAIRRRGLSPGLTAALSVPAIAIAVAAGWIGYNKAQEQQRLEAVDLSAGQKPASRYVVMTAVAQPDLAKSTITDSYVPLTSSAWRRGEPIAYFLKTHASLVERKTDPFRITTPSSRLVSNGLPGPILDLYRKQGIALVDPPVVLDLNTHAEADLYFWAVFLAGLPGLFLLTMSIGLTIRQRHRLHTSVENARPR